MTIQNEMNMASAFGSISGIALSLIGGENSVMGDNATLLRLENEIKKGNSMDIKYVTMLLGEVRKQTNNIYEIAKQKKPL